MHASGLHAMMVMMMNVMLRDRTSVLRFGSVAGILPGQSTPDAEPRKRRQRAATSRASNGLAGREVVSGCPFLPNCRAVGQAMDRFRRRGNGIRTGLWPAEIGREPVKKLLGILVGNRLVVGRTRRLRIVGHCNLTRSIVGEFAA